MDLLNVTIYGDPVPKARPRSGPHGVYTPARTRDAEEVIRAASRRAYGSRPPVLGPVGIDVTFFLSTRRRVDGDNLLKLVTDALQRGRRPLGGVIMDDAQIEEWHCRLFRGVAQARTVVRLYTLEPKAPARADQPTMATTNARKAARAPAIPRPSH